MNALRVKYVMVEAPHLAGLPLPVLLPESLQHDATRALGKPVSAGFCRVVDGVVETFGESHSLNLRPAPRDAQIIAIAFRAVLHPAALVAPAASVAAPAAGPAAGVTISESPKDNP